MENKSTNQTAELLKSILPMLYDLFPLIMDKLAQVNDRPLVRELEEDLDDLDRRHDSTLNKVRWLYSFFFLLLVWNIFLTIFLVFFRH